jgi:heme-degrading monooxygenase HmoA
MIYGAVQVRVKDFAAFLRMLAADKDRAAQYGMLRTQVYRNLEDPNFALLVIEWATDEHIAQFIEDSTPMFMEYLADEPLIFNISEYYEVVN